MHHPRQDNTYHGLYYTSHGALAGMRNSSMGPPWRIDPTTHRTMSKRSYHGATSRSPGEIRIHTLCFSSLASVASAEPSNRWVCNKLSPSVSHSFKSDIPVSRDSTFGKMDLIVFILSGMSFLSLTMISLCLFKVCSISLTTSWVLSLTRDWAVFVVILKLLSISGICEFSN